MAVAVPLGIRCRRVLLSVRWDNKVDKMSAETDDVI